MRRIFWILFAVLFVPVLSAAPEKILDDEKSSSTVATSKPSTTFKGYQPAATTQKAYKIANDGTNQNSSVLQYDSKPGFKVYQDSDSDGRFGEREARGVDSDLDGRKGERESQIGTEFVTQNQKVTVLNNMGTGNALSTFKAAGQTNRASIFKEEKEDHEKDKSLSQETAEPQPSTEKNADAKTKAADTDTKRRVLVS